MSEPEADALVVARMARGDRAALAVLYERHAGRLLALALHVLGNRAEAEDVLHDVFVEAWRHAADYSEQRGSVAAWLALRTRSRSIDRRRAPARARAVPLEASEPAEAHDPAAEPGRIFDRGRLSSALAVMPADEQEVIVLGYFEGLSSSEIAERLGKPIGTVKSRTRSALQKLREMLEPGG
ncbi:MAG TPA: sigma-70 family RNA polymerase sigma factor [Polyangiaceae bacterium]